MSCVKYTCCLHCREACKQRRIPDELCGCCLGLYCREACKQRRIPDELCEVYMLWQFHTGFFCQLLPSILKVCMTDAFMSYMYYCCVLLLCITHWCGMCPTEGFVFNVYCVPLWRMDLHSLHNYTGCLLPEYHS